MLWRYGHRKHPKECSPETSAAPCPRAAVEGRRGGMQAHTSGDHSDHSTQEMEGKMPQSKAPLSLEGFKDQN